MLAEEGIMEIRILSRRGLGVRAIARELGISRYSVRKYLRGEALKVKERRGPGRPRKLEQYEDWIRRRVEGAAPIRLPATVLHREVQAMGLPAPSARCVDLSRVCTRRRNRSRSCALRRRRGTRHRWTGASTG